jgi:hypothetical protein
MGVRNELGVLTQQLPCIYRPVPPYELPSSNQLAICNHSASPSTRQWDSSCCCGGCCSGRLDLGCKLGFLEGDGGDTSGQVAKWARNSSVYVQVMMQYIIRQQHLRSYETLKENSALNEFSIFRLLITGSLFTLR